MDPETFFTEIENSSPYFKLGVEGAAGTGKTYTSALIAVGLYKRLECTKPLVLFDTEKSAKFLKPFFAQHGIKVMLKQSRTLADLTATMDFCNDGGGDILLIDSITHIWEGFIEAFKKRKGRKYIQFQDWGEIKPYWKTNYADRLVMGNCNIIFTGREGYTYEHELNEETNKRELIKTGVKMKVEGDTAYEPDVLIRMERFEKLLAKDKDVWREATVIKDRANLIDGCVFRNPTYENFAPIIEFLMTDVVEPTETESMPDLPGIEASQDHRKARNDRLIMLERNKAQLDEVAAGTTKEAKAMRLSLMKFAYYGETSDTAITAMTIGELTEGNEQLAKIIPIIKKVIGGEPHVYPLTKVVKSARVKYLGDDCVDDIVAAGYDLLVAYRDHIVEKYNEQKAAAGAKEEG